MDAQRKCAILFSATVLAARKLNEVGDNPSPVREECMANAIRNAELILERLDKH
jgi:hypothetical protein